MQHRNYTLLLAVALALPVGIGSMGVHTAAAQTAQEAALTGSVVDSETREPIVGAAVRAEGGRHVATTDENGRFSLREARRGAVITVSCIGYTTRHITYKGDAAPFAAVALSPADSQIKEAVITGVYQRKKESFTGSAVTFTGAELKQIGAQGVLQSLSVLDPAIKLEKNMQFGSDPNRMPEMDIRGKTSVMGLKETYGTDPNQPLFILDGFETTLETVMNLNMNRVASVTLLKDAASTAIYGSKAANGVVVIETVRPQNGRLRLSYKGDFSITAADLSDYNLMNASEKLAFEDLAGIYTDKTGSAANQLRLDNLRNERLKEVARGVDTYWLSEPIRTGFTQKHNLYAEGGEEKMRYGIGLSYNNTQGVMKGSDRRVIGGNIDLIYRTGKFQFSNKLTLDYTKTDDPSVPFSDYARANPYYRKRRADGSVAKYLYVPADDADESPVANPLWNASLNNYDTSEAFGFTNNFIAEWFILPELRARAKFGITKAETVAETRLSPLHTDYDAAEETEKGLYTNSQTHEFDYEGDVALTYGRVFSDRHSVNAVVGFNFESNSQTRNGYSATGFTEDRFSAPSFTTGYVSGTKPSYAESTKRAVSFYFNGGYSYMDRYLLDVNFRRDGASMFGTNNRFRSTWSLGLGWNLHKEAFMAEQQLFQQLKLRASVGNPGNQNFSAYQAFTTYTFNSALSNVFGVGVLVNALGNPDLKWQSTTNYTVGTDITMLGNRLNLNLDVFRKVTDPLLAIITTPGSTGVKSVAMNMGQQATNGVELTARVSPIYMPERDLVWTISLNGRSYKSKYSHIGQALDELNKANQKLPTGTTRYYDGGSPTAIWGVRSAGIDPATGKEVFIKKDGTYTFTYSVDDEVVLGDEQPAVEGTIGTSFYWKGFSLSVYLRYELGAQTFNTALYDKVENISLDDINYNQDKRALYNRWSPTNRDAQFKGISLTQTTEKSSRFVMDNNVLSGESVSLGYEFRQPFIKRAGLSALTLQANMNDFFYASTVKQERGTDYPFARTVSFSLSATF